MENKFENWESYKKRLLSKATQSDKVILSLLSYDNLDDAGFVIVDKDKAKQVSARLRKFYSVWNTADKLPF
jgi:urease accessory protein UreE